MTDTSYDTILRRAVAAAAATGPLAISPIPGPDTAALNTIWATMAGAIARQNGHAFAPDTLKKMVVGSLAGAGVRWTSTKLVTWLIAKIPGAGTITGSAINSGLNVVCTLWFGLSLIDLYEKRHVGADVTFSSDFLHDAMRPRVDSGKIRRMGAFFKRWSHL